MKPTVLHLSLLIAISLVTAGLALAPGSTTLAEEPETVSTDRPEERGGPRNLTLSGQVVNVSSDEPVPDVSFRVYNLWIDEDGEAKGRDVFTVETDEDGRYRANVSQGKASLRVDDPRYKLARAELDVEDDTELTIPLEPVAVDRARVVGTVTDDDGRPIDGADVRLNLDRDACEEREDCDPRSGRSGEGETERQVETDSGTVTFTYEPRVHPYANARTDENGEYEARVPAGPYHVTFQAREHLSEDARVEVAEGDTERVDASLTAIPQASVTVEGRVVDAETGEPIEGAQVRLENQRWGTDDRGRADEDGRFQLAIQPGYTTLEIRASHSYYVPCDEPQPEDGDGAARPASRDCDPHRERAQAYLPVARTLEPAANETIELEQALQPEPEPDASVEGWVVNASSGEAVANAHLRFVNEETGERGTAEAGEDGSFRIAVDEGYYTVHVRAEGYFANATNLQVDGDEEVTLSVTPGEPAQRGCCYVHHETAAADGASHDEATGASAAAEPRPSGDDRTYDGGPGDLGSPPSASSHSGASGADAVPSPGVLGLGLAAAGALAVSRVRRRR